MKILIEGEDYSIDQLNSVFDDPKFYNQNGNKGKIISVGYYHSFEKKELVYMLPKVFMKDNQETVFGIPIDDLFDFENSETFKHKEEYRWIRQLLVYFYNSLTEYKKRVRNTKLIESSLAFELNTNLGNLEYSYLDLLLSFVNFYKKNKNTILYKHIEYKSNQVKKPNWEKTIRKSLPVLTSDHVPVYFDINNKKKVVNSEEELLTYFFSILNHFNKEHHLHIKIDSSYSIIKGEKFEKLQKNGLLKLRKIKYRYFSDTLKRMYALCEMYFSKTDTSSSRKKNDEFISVRNYNVVFEDMIDKLFSDNLDKKKEVDSVSLDKLKYNDDGKIIDHIYDYQSLIDTSHIFYIGDSKYYKSENEAGKLSKYKQFTYAKNVIQFNIDLLQNINEKDKVYKENIKYRDEITEGYNITPNFFIYGYINNYTDFDNQELKAKGKPVKNFHFKDRLFDRDTLFVHQYEINFLFVLKSYTALNQNNINQFRDKNKILFRQNFINFFKKVADSQFNIFEKEMSSGEAKDFVNNNFRLLNGKCIFTNDNRLLIAKFNEDESMKDILSENDFSEMIFPVVK
jgi:hypothetical protein